MVYGLWVYICAWNNVINSRHDDCTNKYDNYSVQHNNYLQLSIKHKIEYHMALRQQCVIII